jgi:FlaA1/EpsC-like NDP-sugar epimerase
MRSSHGPVAGHTFDRLNGERLLSITPSQIISEFPGMKRILITGAAGKIGSVLRKELRSFYPLIRLLDIALWALSIMAKSFTQQISATRRHWRQRWPASTASCILLECR